MKLRSYVYKTVKNVKLISDEEIEELRIVVSDEVKRRFVVSPKYREYVSQWRKYE